MIEELKKALEGVARPEKVVDLKRFFKTGKGEYGEGDQFIGVTVPDQRKVAKKFKEIGLKELSELFKSDVHEYRLTALLVLVEKYAKADSAGKKEIFDFYMKHKARVNNWDLVDLSAPKIVGDYLLDKDRGVLFDLAKSDSIWDRRIAMLACFAFIRTEDFGDALKIAEILVNDSHDLIQKAVGWMLREIGKRDLATEEGFLKKHYKTMPRTALRYAIEKFPEKKRKAYLLNRS